MLFLCIVNPNKNVTITSSILAYLFIGQRGFIGDIGERGAPGFDGIQGKKGESGNSGIPGFAGQRHHSEMFFWVKAELCLIGIQSDVLNSSEQLLAVAGVDGQKGPSGNQGQRGSPGDPGTDGHPGFPGFPGNRGNMNDSLFFLELYDSCLLLTYEK